MNKQQLIFSLKQKGFSKNILNAFSKVPRENFIPFQIRNYAYEDTALPIGNGQTISQPYTIAEMLGMLELKKGQKVLEIGSGCGYVLALLSEIVGEKGKVYGIEIIKELIENSKQNLQTYKNIEIYNKNGAEGLKEESPYDRIIISAAIKEIPKQLTRQLKNKGILVAPVENQESQTLTSFQKLNDKLEIKKQLPGFVFVKFID